MAPKAASRHIRDGHPPSIFRSTTPAGIDRLWRFPQWGQRRTTGVADQPGPYRQKAGAERLLRKLNR